MNTNNFTKEDLIDLYARVIASGDMTKDETETAKTRDDLYWKNGKLSTADTEKKNSKN